MTLVAERPHNKHGSSVFVRDGLKVNSIFVCEEENVEFITVELPGVVVHSLYKPPPEPFLLPPLGQRIKSRIVIGDFNSHSTLWGYTITDSDGEAVEQWADSYRLSLIHNAKLPKSFNSAIWKKGYNPDLIFVSSNISDMPTKPKCPALPAVEGKPSLVSAFSEEEYRKGIAVLKNNKAAGIDDILVEQLKNLGPKAHKWLHTMLNTCFIENKIPKIWRQSKIIAILKPGKDSAISKNYRPISLLCHTYKLYERLILNRVSPLLEQHLIKEQAGFRPGKSCTSRRLILTQHIEDGYQIGMITGAAFVDLSAAYDTVNHGILIQKLYNTTQDINYVESFRTCCPTEDYMWN